LTERNGAVVEGIGYCNKNLPRNRWRYSAVRAAELGAWARLLEKSQSGVTALKTGTGGWYVEGTEYRYALQRAFVSFDKCG